MTSGNMVAVPVGQEIYTPVRLRQGVFLTAPSPLKVPDYIENPIKKFQVSKLTSWMALRMGVGAVENPLYFYSQRMDDDIFVCC